MSIIPINNPYVHLLLDVQVLGGPFDSTFSLDAHAIILKLL